MDKKNEQRVIYAMSVVLLIVLLQNWLPDRPMNVFSNSEFEQLSKDRQIEEVHVRQDTQAILEGQRKKLAPTDEKLEELLVTPQVDSQLPDRLGQSEVQSAGVFEGTWLPNLLSWVLPVLFFFALWWFFVRRFAEKQG
jgi:cell division protease FtsH